MKTGKVGAVFLGVIIVIALVICCFSFKKVPAGYVGVVYNFSTGISDKTLSQGWHFVAPTKKVTIYSIGISRSSIHYVPP